MLPKGQRLRTKALQGALKLRGKRFDSESLGLKVVSLDDGIGGGLAVVVSKKVSKGAIDRNRIKRKVYEAARELGDGEKLSKTNAILFVKANLSNTDQKELECQVSKLLGEAHLLKTQ